jgi:hypothetical protein
MSPKSHMYRSLDSDEGYIPFSPGRPAAAPATTAAAISHFPSRCLDVWGHQLRQIEMCGERARGARPRERTILRYGFPVGCLESG